MRADIAERVGTLRILTGHLVSIFERYRRGEVNFDPASAKTFADGLAAIAPEVEAIVALSDDKVVPFSRTEGGTG